MSNSSTGKRKTEHNAGSPQTGEPVFLMIGKLRRPHGLNGEVLAEVLEEHSASLKPGSLVFVGKKLIRCVVASVRQADKFWLIRFEGYGDSQTVAGFTNQMIQIDLRDAAPLPEGQFYLNEIIGMQVLDESEQSIGAVTEVIVTGANDVYVIRSESGEEILIPAIKSVILKMDREANLMIIRLQEWL